VLRARARARRRERHYELAWLSLLLDVPARETEKEAVLGDFALADDAVVLQLLLRARSKAVAAFFCRHVSFCIRIARGACASANNGNTHLW